MIFPSKTKHKIIFLFILAVVFELILFFVFYRKYGFNLYFSSDAAEYIKISLNFINHGTLSVADSAPYAPSNWRTPVYPLWLATIRLISGSFVPAIFLSILVFSLTAPLTYLIGREVFNEKIGVLAGIFFIFEPWGAFSAGFLMTEQIFVPLFALTVYLFIKYLKTGINKFLYASAAILGIVTLVRPTTIYLWPILLIFLIFFRKHIKFMSAKNLIYATLIFSIVIAPWIIRNKLFLNTWQISSAQGFTLYIDRFGALESDIYGKAKALIGDLDIRSQAASDILAKAAIAGIEKNLFSYIKISIISAPDFFIANAYSNLAFELGSKDFKIQGQLLSLVKAGHFNQAVGILRRATFAGWVILFSGLIWPLLSISALIGFIVSFKEFSKSKIEIYGLAVIIFYFVLIHLLIASLPRYRLPVEPILFIFVAAGIIYLVDKLKLKAMLGTGN